MAIIGIVALDRNNAIGKGGALPWRYPADLRFFREQTTGHVCVMGRRTWASLAKPLPNRLNVVLSRGLGVGGGPGVLVLRDRESVLSLAPYLAGHLFVIGGAEVFAALGAEIDEWIVTRVPVAVESADTFMPADFLAGFRPRDSRDLGDGLVATFYARAN